MRLMLLFGLLLQAGCLHTDLGFDGGPPFACTDGACPSGYHCAQALCIADGAAEPPLAVASSSLTDAPPILLWNGSGFAAVWQDTSDPATAGVHFALIDAERLGTDLRVTEGRSPVSFSALYEQVSHRYVIATARNDLTASELTVVSTDGQAQPTSALPSPEVYPASPIGFSRPALSSRQDGTVTLAYTRGDPPQLSSKNLFCQRLSLTTPGAVTDPCGPTLTVAQFASEVVVAEFPVSTIFQWKAMSTYLTVEVKGALPGRTRDVTNPIDRVVHTEKILNTNRDKGSFAVVGQYLDATGAPTWQLRVGDARTTAADTGVSTLQSGLVVPDIDGDGMDGFVLCRGEADGTAAVTAYAIAVESVMMRTVLTSGSAHAIPRYSKAPIESCRVAVARETGTLGVLWRERVPPATGKLYFTTMPLPER